jgi:predicted transcriptional regulator
VTLTIHLAPEEEANLHEKSVREGLNAEVVAHDVLVRALEWENQDRAEAIAGIQHGLEDFEQGRFRRFSEFEREQRAKYALPSADK